MFMHTNPTAAQALALTLLFAVTAGCGRRSAGPSELPEIPADALYGAAATASGLRVVYSSGGELRYLSIPRDVDAPLTALTIAEQFEPRPGVQMLSNTVRVAHHTHGNTLQVVEIDAFESRVRTTRSLGLADHEGFEHDHLEFDTYLAADDDRYLVVGSVEGAS